MHFKYIYRALPLSNDDDKTDEEETTELETGLIFNTINIVCIGFWSSLVSFFKCLFSSTHFFLCWKLGKTLN